MRLSAPVVTLAIAAACIGSCGAADRRTGSTARKVATSGSYLNDGDNDGVGDDDGDNNADRDQDPRLDYKPDENGDYHDADEAGLLHSGRAPGRAEQRAIATAVERYYAAAAAGNGAAACEMLTPRLAHAVPLDYGQNGPSYLRGGKTCAKVLALLFDHYRVQLAAPTAVTGVRVSGRVAYALLGSARMPASYILMQREGHSWKLNQLLGNESSLP